MIDKSNSLKFAWDLYLKLMALGAKLTADGAKLLALGNQLWAKSVLEAYGNVTIEWKSDRYCLVNGVDAYTDNK
jgi:hypothetical protein